MADVYKIGVSIAMTNGVSQVLGLIARDLLGLKKGIGEAEAGFTRMKLAAVGAIAAIAGGAALRGLWDMTKQAEALNHELVKIKIGAGLSDAQVAGVRTAAYAAAGAVPGTSVADAVKVQRELFGTFGDMAEAKNALQDVLRANAALSRYGDDKTDVAQTAIRALEMRGHISKDGKVNPEEFQKELDSLTRSIIASEGLLKPNDYLQAIRQAGPAAMAMSADAFWGMMPAAMVAMGSQKAGTALSSLYTQVIGHVVAGKRTAVAMEEAGMLKPGSWRVERGGHVVMDKDAVVDQNKFAADPFTYMHDLIERNKENKKLDLVGVVQEIFQLSSRITSARLISDVSQNWPIFQNEQARYHRAGDGASASAEFNAHDLQANVDNLDAAWKNFMTSLGEPGVPIAVGILHKLTDVIKDLTAWASTHQEVVGIIEQVTAGLGGLAFVLGTMAVGSAAASALGLLTASNGLLGLAVGIEALGKAMPSLPSWLIDMVAGTAGGAGVGAKIAGPEGALVGGAAGFGIGSTRRDAQNALDGLKDYGANSPIIPGRDGFLDRLTDRLINALATSTLSVQVTNPGDIARGTTGYQTNQATKPPTGPTQPTVRLTPAYPSAYGG